MTPDLRAQLDGFGRDLTPALLGGTQGLFAGINRGLDPATQVTRDIAYGPHDRHRLDLFARAGISGAPVLVYVHGGGFVMGDKHTEGSPFYSNIGDFAARMGWLGVTITYRLAPASQFPSGPEDLALVVGWLREHAAAHGGDPSRIILMGQSAGASHVAGYLAHRPEHAAGVAGAVLMSGIFDPTTASPNDFAAAYYGPDRASWGAANCMAGLIASPVPMQFSVTEFDPADFHQQAAQVVAQWFAAKGVMPEMHWLAGHNHLSPALCIGSAVGEVEAMVKGFVGRCLR